MHAPTQTKVTQLPRRVARRLRRSGMGLLRTTRAITAKAFYSLPLVSRRNPRSMLAKCSDHCIGVDSFPIRSSLDSKDWYLRIRPCETIRRKLPFSIHQRDLELFYESITRHNQGEVFRFPEVFLACINKARLYSKDFLVISADKKRLYRESALSRDDILETNGIFDTIIWPSLKEVPGDFCLLAGPWSHKNYSEWLLGNLPRLSIIEQFDELSSTRLIVPSPLRSYQEDTLLMAGIRPERLVGFDNSHWQVDRLYFPELPSPLGNPSPHAVSWLRARFLGQMPASPAASKRLLYVTRRDASQRRVLNEEEIVNYLMGLGFEIICPGDFSFRDQINIFRDASIVIGPHGAAFANMVFAPPNATLIEFFGNNYLHGCYWALTNIRGQKHAFLTGPSQWLDYSISLEQLKLLLAKVCGI